MSRIKSHVFCHIIRRGRFFYRYIRAAWYCVAEGGQSNNFLFWVLVFLR